MRRRRERGSIVIYMAMCLLVLTVLFGAIVPLATQLRARTTRRSDELRTRLAFDAGVAAIKSQSISMRYVNGTSIPISTNGVTGSVKAVANDAQLVNSLKVTGTLTRNGKSYSYMQVIGARQPSPYMFAICSDSALSLKSPQTGSASDSGDVFSNGTLTITSGGGQINGNVAAVGALSVGSTTITGRQLTAQPTIVWPTANSVAYLTENTLMTLSGLGYVAALPATETSITFPSPLNGKYAIRYYTLGLTLSGTISGKGTIFVNGNLTINGNITYADSSSEVSIIATGNITVSSSVDTLNGYYFSGGTFAHSKDLTLPRGGIATEAYDSGSKAITIVRDNAIRNDTDEAVRLRLPYYWP